MAKPAAHKPKRRKVEEEKDAGDAALAKRLAAYGERFLQMFDDHDNRGAAAAPAPAEDTGSSDDSEDESDATDSGDAASGDSDSEDRDGGDKAPAGGRRRSTDVVKLIFDARGRRVQPAVGVAAATGKPVAGGARGAGPAGGIGGAPAATTAQQQQQQDAEQLRLERKRFMSHKAAVITGSSRDGGQQAGRRRSSSAGAGGSSAGAAEGQEEGISRAQFLKMQREVQMYGASALDRKSKRKFEAEQLARLGAKADSRPRVSAKIGLGMARKQAQRDEHALQEGIAAGMIRQKGLGKKKRREKAKGVDRGLMEDGGAFKPGIMRVRPPHTGGGSGSGSGGRKRKRK